MPPSSSRGGTARSPCSGKRRAPGAGLWALVVDEGGRKLGEPMFLGSGVRLGREMLLRRRGSRVFTLASVGGGARLCFLRYE